MKNVLVLCTGNSCRSQMMQGYLRKMTGMRAKIYSAGTRAIGINPLAINVMKEDGVDISDQTSNDVEIFRNAHLDFILTVCDNAKEECPWFPSEAQRFHQSFEDPASFEGSPAETLVKFREVRDQIKQYAEKFANNQLR